MNAGQIKINNLTQNVNIYNHMYKFYTQVVAVITVLLSLVFPLEELNAQIFAEQTGISLTGVSGSTQAWGDYDNDGDLDLLIAGYTGSANIVELYKNNGDNTFTKTTNTFAVNTLYDAAWGDYDNDGDLDLLLASTLNSKLYDNNGNGTFTLKASLPEVFMGKCTWADLNNDGFCDIILTGSGGTHILKNNKNGTFTNQTTSIPTVSNYSSVACGDYDNDGDWDILIAGLSGTSEITKVFKNNLDFSFAEQTDIVLPGIANCSVALVDIDNDSDLEIILSGGATNVFTKIYENKGSNSFVELTVTPLQELYRSCMDIADYDNDGYRDIIITGSNNGSDYITNIYINNKNKTFSKIAGESIPGVQFGTVKWGDYDNDGRLDLFICGNASGGKIAKIFKNSTTIANSDPAVLTNLKSAINNITSVVSFGWDNGMDEGVTQNGLTYNLYVYLLGDTDFVRSPQAFKQPDAKNGRRLVAQIGGIQRSILSTYHYNLQGLTDGKYMWSVQAVDAGLRGGAFAAENSFIVAEKNIYTYQSAVKMDSVGSSAVAWGDYNNDGYQDFLITGQTNSRQNISKIYKNDGNGNFTWQQGIVLPGVFSGAVAWGDYNNDNYLDFLLTGYTNAGRISNLYKNNGNGTFSEETKAVLTPVGKSAVAWGDYNNDGYQDILLTGRNSSDIKISRILKNNKDGSFSELTSVTLPNITDGAVTWGDYNNDGNLDFILIGQDENQKNICNLYKNNGNGTFTLLSQSFQGLNEAAAAWGDFNNDGLLDFAVSGININIPDCSIFKNNGDETFTAQTHMSMTSSKDGTLAWGDYNNDGYSDLLALGGNSSIIYRNDHGANITKLNASIPSVTGGKPNGGFSDYDRDGKLDVLLTGNNITISKTIGGVYKNVGQYAANTPPMVPSNLQQTVQQNAVTLSWNKATDLQTPQNGLSYNIYIKNAANGKWIKSPLAIVDGPLNGQRLVSQKGDVQLGATSYVFRDLPTGNYSWSVQAVDGAFAGSNFATESSFTVVLGSEIDVNVAKNELTNTRTDLEYSINSTNGADGSWLVCTSPNTTVNFGNGGFDVWVRVASSTSNVRKIATIAPPAAAPVYTINYPGESTYEIATPGANYSLNANMSGYSTVNEAKVPLVPGKTNYIQVKATATAVASGILTLSVPERPAKTLFSIDYRNECTNENVPASIEYATETTMVNSKSGTNGKVQLVPGQSVYFRIKSTPSTFASEIQILKAPERVAPPVYTIDYVNESTGEIFEDMYNTDGSIQVWYILNYKISLALTPGKNLYFATAATSSSFRSNLTLFNVPERPLTPTSPIGDDAANTFDWTNNPSFTNASDYEYSVNNGSSWNVCTAKPVTIGNINAAIGAVRVRIKASSTGFRSNELVSVSAFTSTTGINTISEAGITLFPNPVTDILYIRDAPIDSKISILTIDGSLVKEILSVADKDNITVTDLPSGIYLIKIKTDNAEIQGKFVKQ